FLHDCCCAPTIRTAELHDDQAFIMQLTSAIEYQPTLRRRDALQVYYYILLLLESWGVSLPTLNELWSTLDPYRREYKSLSAFEKDFQRRRRDFNKMLKEADEELAIQWKSAPRRELGALPSIAAPVATVWLARDSGHNAWGPRPCGLCNVG